MWLWPLSVCLCALQRTGCVPWTFLHPPGLRGLVVSSRRSQLPPSISQPSSSITFAHHFHLPSPLIIHLTATDDKLWVQTPLTVDFFFPFVVFKRRSPCWLPHRSKPGSGLQHLFVDSRVCVCVCEHFYLFFKVSTCEFSNLWLCICCVWRERKATEVVWRSFSLFPLILRSCSKF